MTEQIASKDHRPGDADGRPEASSDPAAGSSGLIVERPRASTVAAPGLPETFVVGVLEAAPDAMLVVDGCGIIRLLNAQTERMFGYRRDELMGQPVETLVPERFRPVHVQHRAKFAAAPRFRPINTGTVQIARRKDGGEFPADISLSPLFAEGEALVIAAVRDITDRCEAEAALRESEERFRVALKHASVVVSHQDCDLRYTWVHNPHPWFSAEAVLGKTDAELMPLDEGARLTEIKRRVLETGRGARAEVRTTVGGVAYHYDLSVEPLYDADGRVTGITCASLDVTERVRAEAARLRLAEEQAAHAGAERERAFVSAVLDTVGALVVVLDRQGRIVRFNRACEELTGYTFDEVRGRPLWDFLLIPEEVEPVKAVFERLRAGQFPSRHEHHWLTRDGGRRWIAWSNSALLDARGEVEHVIGTGIDITERRQAEAQLRKLSRAVESSANTILITDARGNIEYVNPKFTQITGYASDEVVGMNPRMLKSGHTPPEEYGRLWTTIKAGGEWRGEFLNRKKNGELYWESASISAIAGLDGAITHFVAVKEDITELKRAEAALRASEGELRALFAAMTDVVLVYDADGRYLRIAPTSPELLYRPAAELLGETVHEVLPPELADAFLGYIRRALEAQRTVRAEYRLDIGGREVWFEAAISPMEPAGQVIWVARDITARMQAQKALRESEQKFSVLFRKAPFAIALSSLPNGTFVDVNETFEELFGYSREEVLGKTSLELGIHRDPELRARILAELQQRGTVRNAEGTYFTRSGAGRVFSNNLDVVEIGGRPYLFSAIQDITERKQAEAELSRSERLLRLFVEHSPAAIAMFDRDMRYVVASRRFLQDYGLGNEDLTGRSHYDVFPEIPERRKEVHRRVLAGAVERAEEDPFRRADGRLDWVRWEMRPWYDTEGEIGGVILFSEVITERKRAERALCEALQRLESHVEHSGLAVVEWDADFVVTRWAGEAERMFGWSAAETVGKAIADLRMIYEPDIPHVGRVMEKLADGVTRTVISENRNVTKDGRVIHCTWYNSVLLDEQGQMASVLSLVLDHTERVQAEAQLRKLSRAVESSANMILITDARGNIEYVNPKFTQITGYASDEVVGKNPRMLKSGHTPPEEYGRLWTTIKAGGEWRGEFLNRKKNGELYWESASISAIAGLDGAITHFVAVKEDITELKHAEAALRESEERYRRLVELSPDAIVVHSGGRVVFANPATARLLRVASADELIGAPVMDFVPDEHREIVVERIRHALATGLDIPLLEEQLIRADGTRVDVEVSGIPLYYREQPAVQLVVRDITERRRAAAALAAEKERLAVTLRSIGDGVVASDTDGRVVLMNPVAEALTGWPASEALGRPVAEVFHIVNDRTHQPIEDPVAVVLRSGSPVGLANHTALIARDGTSRAIADSGAPIRDEAGQVLGVVLVFQDVTEKQRLDAELAKANKLDALGVLAGGIAHDFNNILTAILANTSLTKMTVARGSKPHQWLTEVEKASRRAKDLTQQLLTFAKGGAPVRQLASLDDLVRDSATFALRGSNVQPVFDLADDLWPAEVDPGQISQVIQNLVINAQQAMPQGGAVRVSADNTTLGPDQGLPLAAGRYLKIGVADRGTGIHPEHLPRIFDPFFTTKQTGSGLGLATSYAIVQKHGGHIVVESVLGQGTTVAVYLPAAEGALPAPESPAGQVMVGRGHILVMDDEEPVREVLREILTRTGYRVVLAVDGPAAIAEYRRAREAGEPFDAVVLDLTVPGGMGGRQVLDALRQLDPAVRAIASSGYSTDPIMSDFRAHGFAGVVAKPYTAEEVNRVMRAVVSSQSPVVSSQ